MNLSSAAGSFPDPGPRLGRPQRATAVPSHTVVGEGFERNEAEVTVSRTWREREDCYSRWGVLPCAASETAYLFVLSVAGLGIRPLVRKPMGEREVNLQRKYDRALEFIGRSCQVPVTLSLSSDLAENTTKHRPTPCPRCYHPRLSSVSIFSHRDSSVLARIMTIDLRP